MREFTLKNTNLKFSGKQSGESSPKAPRESSSPATNEASPDEVCSPEHDGPPSEEPTSVQETPGPATPPHGEVQPEEGSPSSGRVQRTLTGLEQALQKKQEKLEQLCSDLDKIRDANTTLDDALKRMLRMEFDLSEQLAAIRDELSSLSRAGMQESEQVAPARDSLTTPSEAADTDGGNGAQPTRTPDAAVDQGSRDLVLQGTLDQVQVSEVLEFVRIHRKTGKVTVDGEDMSGVIHLVGGEAVFASAGDQQGFPAFTALMDAVRGRVEFVSEKVDKALQNLSRGTIPLMMDALRLLDERDSQLRR